MALNPRIFLDTDRLIISKTGVDATANPADADKIFDSDWAFGGAIIASGIAEFVWEGANPGPGNHAINIPALDYKPTVLLFDVYPPGSYSTGGTYRGDQMIVFGPYLVRYNPTSDPSNKNYQFAQVVGNQILIPYRPNASSYTVTTGTYIYCKDNSGSPIYKAHAYCVFAV